MIVIPITNSVPVCVEGVVVGLWGAPGGKIPQAQPYAYSTTFYGCGPRPFRSVSNCAHLSVWEVGWGHAPLDLCGVLVRESRATWLAVARWGPSPDLYH